MLINKKKTYNIKLKSAIETPKEITPFLKSTYFLTFSTIPYNLLANKDNLIQYIYFCFEIYAREYRRSNKNVHISTSKYTPLAKKILFYILIKRL